LEIEITPAHVHIHLDELLRAGDFRNITVSDPGAHGAVTGTHGVGVNTPLAAAVADAVVGFAKDEHVANGGILDTGIESRILAATFLSAITVGTDTMRVEGADPKLQDMLADRATNCAIIHLPFVYHTFYKSSISKTRSPRNLTW
jgi:hypothetical protein